MGNNRPIYSLLFFCLFLNTVLSASPAFKKEKPEWNVILISIDTLRADRLSCYSRKHLETPNIDSLAKRGVLFSKAFANTPATLPSHTDMFTGTTPLYHGVHENGTFVLQDEFLTLAEHLKSFGYSTGAFVGAYPLDSRFGLAQGFDVYDDDYSSPSSHGLAYVERKAELVVDSALEWLQAQDSPWFLFLHCFDPHDPYDPPEPFKSKYKNNFYEGEIAYVDHALEKFLSYIEEKGLYDETIIIFTGDHGESLGQHGEITHAYFAYNTTLQVPLIISVPGVKPGRIEQYVSHVDIFPTVCDALKIKAPSFLHGTSLLPALKGKKIVKKPIYFEAMYPYYSRGWAPLNGYIANGVKFTESPIPELYNIEQDFDELKNLAEEKKLDKYRKQLVKIIKEQFLPESMKAEQKIDRESLEKLKSLGYISSPQVPKKKKFGPEMDIKTLLPFHNKSMGAMKLYKEGNVAEATRLLKEVITERMDIDIAYSNLATIYKETGRLGEALEVLKLGLDNLPSSYEVFSTYINYLIDAGQFDEGIKLFKEKSLRQMGHDPEIWNYLGVAYYKKGDFDNAILAYKQALSLDKDYPVAYCNLGTSYFSLSLKSKDETFLQKSIQAYKKAIELDSDYASPYNGLGSAYRYYGRLADAILILEKALSLNPDFGNALYNLGMTYLDKGYKAKALVCFNKYKEKYYRVLPLKERQKLEALIKKCNEKF